MKKHLGKKTLSIFLAVLMVLAAIPLAAVPATAAGGTLTQKGWAIISSSGGRVDTNAGTFNVCNDGTKDAVSVGFIDFDISGISGTVDAKLNISGKNSGNSNYNGEAFLEIFSIAPDKRPSVSGAKSDNFNDIFGSSGWPAYNSYTHANNAKNTLGIKNQPALAVMRSKDMDNNQTKAYSFDISEAVNNAKRAGQSKLYLAFINPKSYKGKPSWSDINVFYNTANITYTSAGSTEVNHSGATLLYTDNNTRGDANHLNICSDGGRGNTTAAFLKFDISDIPTSAASVSFSTSVWCAEKANQNVVADIFSIDPTKCINTNGWQTTDPYNAAFGTGTTPDITKAKNYFGATDSIAQIGIKKDGITSTAKTVTYDITSAVREAKAAGRTELCLMIINPQSYSGNASVGWSDINIAPGATKLIYSTSSSANAYGNYNSGKYYVKLVLKIFEDGYWNNGINKAWIGFYYKTNNGTGEEQHVDMPVAPGTFETAGNKTLEYVLDGFPTKIETDCGGITNSNFACQPQQLFVGAYAGDYHLISQDVETAYQEKRVAQGQKTRVKTWWYKNDSTINYPYATTFDWKTSPAETFVPKTVGSANTVPAAVVAKDQYGVVMGTEYTATIDKVKQGGLGSFGATGVSVSQAYKSDFTAYVAESAKVANTDWFNGKLTVNVADANSTYSGTNSKLFKIVNQKEDVSIDENGGTLSRANYRFYYGSALNADINLPLNESNAFPPTGTREGYTLDGIYNGSIKVKDNDVIYSDASYAAKWNINKYTVTFLDATGKTIRTETVDYGKGATAPLTPTKAYDDENHYVFANWDTDFTNVKSDLTVSPVYTTVKHNLVRDEKNDTAAKCENDAIWAYKCTGCAYTTKVTQENTAPGHTWKENIRIPADCENDGKVVSTCSVCGTEKTEVLAALGHDYKETVIREATCTVDGLKKYICSHEGCNATDPTNGGDEGVVISAPGTHDFGEWETVETPKCGKAGLKRAKCNRENCEYHNEYYTEAIAALEHDFSGDTLTKESTCTKAGYTYKECKNGCGATKKVADLPLADHTLGEWTTDVKPTCVQKGSKVQICSVCKQGLNRTEVPALGHDYQNYTEVSPATCTEPAKEKGTCSRCDATETRNIPGSTALGHDCPEDGYVYNNDAKCEIDGTESSNCTRCDYKATRTKAGTALGHLFTTYIYNGDATCLADGTKTAQCDRHCGATDTVAAEGTKKEHNVENYEFNDDATCLADGTKSGVCSMCKETITITALGTKKAHSFTNYTHNTDATCLEPATEIAYCDNDCGTSDIRNVGTRGAHIYPDPVTEADKYTPNNDSTCKQRGTMSAYCTVCHLAKKTVEDPNSKLAHRILNWISDGNATCTEDGTKHGTCAYCGEYSEKDVADVGSALGHWFRDYKFVENSATCTKDGIRTAVCEREGCDETKTINAVGSALGHDWSDWKLTGEDANCTNGGTLERHCLRDGCVDTETGKPAEETKTVGALGHNFKWVMTESSENDCTVGGEKVKVCTVCDYVDESSRVTLPGSAHNFAVTEYVAPTCTAEGKRVVSCTVCGKVYSSETLEKTGHLNYSLDESSVIKATCKDEGYTGDYTCDVCGEVVVAGTATERTTEHVFSEYAIIKQATCTENATEESFCSVCGEVKNDREVPGSALGHSFTNYVSDGNATCTGIETLTAVCDRDGCEVTDTVKKYGSALGHDWSDWSTVKAATCTESGLSERHCKRDGCGVKVEKELRKLSHKESAWIVDKEATCTEEGHRYKQCTAGCGYIFAEETIAKKDHTYVVSESTATCIDDGYSTYTCTSCGTQKKGEVVHALGHEYGEWVITKSATCKRRGEKTIKCERCGITLATEVIEKTPHVDADGDGLCDDCGAETGNIPAGNCGCICHKTHWFMRILYAICRFFWKIFGLRSTCPCGAKHY